MSDDESYAISIPGFSEPVGAITHLGGAGVFLVMTWWLLKKGRGDSPRLLFLSVFAFTVVFLLSMSGVFHLLEPGGAGRAVLRRLDHAAIFTLIAGTFTPIHGILFRGPWRWGVLTFMWCSAAVGVTLKSIFFEAMPPWLGVVIYVAMGWVGLASAIKLRNRFAYSFIAPLVNGGIAYTAGAACLGLLVLAGDPMIIPGVVGRHELFHLAVLAGAAYHWAFIYSFADFNTRSSPLRYQV